jgi:hypothetical protein
MNFARTKLVVKVANYFFGAINIGSYFITVLGGEVSYGWRHTSIIVQQGKISPLPKRNQSRAYGSTTRSNVEYY